MRRNSAMRWSMSEILFVAPTKTKEFIIKRKLMAYLLNKVVHEVLMD